MRKVVFALSAILAAGSIAWAADSDPLAARKALMDGNAAAAALAGAMLKGDMDYNPAAAKAAIAQLHGTAVALGAFFPEGSDKGDTTASPKIWEDAAGFQAELEKYRKDAQLAFDASGKDGPADLDAFKAAVTPVLGSCRSCHEDWRVKKN